MSKSTQHTAILELEMFEGFFYLPLEINYTYFAKIPASGPSWDSGGEPEEPATVEVDQIESGETDRPLPDWMLELAWQYVQEQKLDDLLEIAEQENGEQDD